MRQDGADPGLMRQRRQHFVLSKTPRLHAYSHDAVNATLHLVYAALTVAPDFKLVELEPDEAVHLNDTFAAREKQPFVLVESLCVAGETKQTHGINCR